MFPCYFPPDWVDVAVSVLWMWNFLGVKFFIRLINQKKLAKLLWLTNQATNSIVINCSSFLGYRGRLQLCQVKSLVILHVKEKLLPTFFAIRKGGWGQRVEISTKHIQNNLSKIIFLGRLTSPLGSIYFWINMNNIYRL